MANRFFLIVVIAALSGSRWAAGASAEPGSLESAGIPCNAPKAWRTGPNGRVEVCLDGKYSTCVRDARDRLGWGQSGVERCNGIRARGQIK
jgi:hypothetical protein